MFSRNLVEKLSVLEQLGSVDMWMFVCCYACVYPSSDSGMGVSSLLHQVHHTLVAATTTPDVAWPGYASQPSRGSYTSYTFPSNLFKLLRPILYPVTGPIHSQILFTDHTSK